jgi:multicomponent Na+:H+ antiporter subunit B
MMGTPGTGSSVVRFVSRRAIPLIQLYALYVLAHGENGPGGGFQGGVIFASALILAALVGGWRTGRKEIPEPVSDALMPAGAFLYGAIGLAALLSGGAFLQYSQLAPEHAHAAHFFGIMGIEIGVMITVAGSMVTLFLEMSRPIRYLDRGAPARPRPEQEVG